jgi:hypothetical protein
MAHKVIAGVWETKRVRIGAEEILPKESLELVNHSPTGFNWGYCGSGPAQLSLAILLKYTTQEEALKFYQDFKHEVIAHIPQDDFFMTDSYVVDWLLRKRREQTVKA